MHRQVTGIDPRVSLFSNGGGLDGGRRRAHSGIVAQPALPHVNSDIVPLTPGDHLGPYEILSPLGAGGMGEVYRARDTKLNRDVAIKVLPATLANDADYLARFQREAQALAALHHPNIATIFGLEQNAIVMKAKIPRVRCL